MPETVTLYLIAVWFCVGFFTALGWTLGCWVMSRLLSRF